MSIRSNVDRGALNERIALHRKTVTQGVEGEVSETWAELGQVWAKVDAAKAGERFKDATIVAVGAYTVWIRAEVYRQYGLVPNDRVEWRGRFLDIKAIPDQQLRGRLVALFCDEGLNHG